MSSSRVIITGKVGDSGLQRLNITLKRRDWRTNAECRQRKAERSFVSPVFSWLHYHCAFAHFNQTG